MTTNSIKVAINPAIMPPTMAPLIGDWVFDVDVAVTVAVDVFSLVVVVVSTDRFPDRDAEMDITVGDKVVECNEVEVGIEVAEVNLLLFKL